ncbi:MAG: hypothetical protein U0V56_10755 [Actinomycetota bacterium]
MLLKPATDAQTRCSELRLRTEGGRRTVGRRVRDCAFAFIAAVIVTGVALLGQGTKSGYEKVVFP